MSAVPQIGSAQYFGFRRQARKDIRYWSNTLAEALKLLGSKS